MILRYLHRPHRSGEVAPRRHPVPQLVEVVPLVGLRTARCSRRPRPAPRHSPGPFPRLVDEALSNLKRLHLRASVPPPAPPPKGWPSGDLGLPGPLAPAPLQGLHRYYEPVRPCAPHRYSAAHGVRRLRVLPLATRGRPAPISTGRRYRDDRFSCSMPAPATSSRHLYTGHRQGNMQAAPWLKAHPPGRAVVPGPPTDPGFDAIVDFSRCVSSGSHTFVFSSPT